MHYHDGFPDHFDVLPNPFKRIAKCVNYLLNMHQLSPISEHFGGAEAVLDDQLDLERRLGHQVLTGHLQASEAYGDPGWTKEQ